MVEINAQRRPRLACWSAGRPRKPPPDAADAAGKGRPDKIKQGRWRDSLGHERIIVEQDDVLTRLEALEAKCQRENHERHHEPTGQTGGRRGIGPGRTDDTAPDAGRHAVGVRGRAKADRRLVDSIDRPLGGLAVSHYGGLQRALGTFEAETLATRTTWQTSNRCSPGCAETAALACCWYVCDDLPTRISTPARCRTRNYVRKDGDVARHHAPDVGSPGSCAAAGMLA